jgi:hypothetical protein
VYLEHNFRKFQEESDMSDWIPFKEGSYLVEQAFLMTPDYKAVTLEEAIIDIYLDRQNKRQMQGRGLVRNVLVVQLLEDHETIDFLLDLGDEFKYVLRNPSFKAGKVFSPDTKSLLRFAPTSPWEHIPESEFAGILSRLELL